MLRNSKIKLFCLIRLCFSIFTTEEHNYLETQMAKQNHQFDFDSFVKNNFRDQAVSLFFHEAYKSYHSKFENIYHNAPEYKKPSILAGKLLLDTIFNDIFNFIITNRCKYKLADIRDFYIDELIKDCKIYVFHMLHKKILEYLYFNCLTFSKLRMIIAVETISIFECLQSNVDKIVNDSFFYNPQNPFDSEKNWIYNLSFCNAIPFVILAKHREIRRVFLQEVKGTALKQKY